MLGQGILSQSSLQSVIGSSSILAPSSARHKKSIFAELLLTALIDAFSILVIFLLMSFSSTGEILFMSKDMELPKASQAEILDRSTVVKVQEGQIFLEEKQMTVNELTAELLELRKKFNETHGDQEFPAVITIQADRRIKYEFLSQIIAAASQAGISDIKFATLMK